MRNLITRYMQKGPECPKTVLASNSTYNFPLKHDCTVGRKEYDTLSRVNKWVQLTDNVIRWSWMIGVGGLLWLLDRWAPGNARVRKSAWAFLSIVTYQIMYAICVPRLTSHAWSLQSRDGYNSWPSFRVVRVQPHTRWFLRYTIFIDAYPVTLPALPWNKYNKFLVTPAYRSGHVASGLQRVYRYLAVAGRRNNLV